MPKTLGSLNIEDWLPGQNLPLLKKLVKPYKKYLRNIKGSVNCPPIQKLLPLLTDLEVSLTPDNLRALSLHPGFKRLNLHFGPDWRRKTSGRVLLMKYKTSLSSNLAKIKGLTSMSMTIKSEEVQAAHLMLEIIDQNLSLDSLEQSSLDFVSGFFPSDFQKPLEQKTSIRNVLARLTHLSSDNSAWYSFLISSGKLSNLSVLKLKLKLSSEEMDWGLKDLLQFHNLPKLKKFALDFNVPSFPSERAFFENFTLPSSLEDLSLTLTGFTLSLINDNDPVSCQLFHRLQEAKSIKALNLKITENTANLAFTAKFACLLIKCFGRLETLEYQNPKESSYFRKNNTEAEAIHLDFQEFWTAITPSKETLRSISVGVSEIIFPEDVNTLETGFPRLQKLHLQESVSSGGELGRFCQKISSLRDLNLAAVKFQDEEKLKMFLDDMKEIPKWGDFDLSLDVEDIGQEPLIGCLKKYVEDVRIRGRLGIHFTGVRVEDKHAFREVLRMVVNKGRFNLFKVIMKNSRQLFSVTKFCVLRAEDGLI